MISRLSFSMRRAAPPEKELDYVGEMLERVNGPGIMQWASQLEETSPH